MVKISQTVLKLLFCNSTYTANIYSSITTDVIPKSFCCVQVPDDISYSNQRFTLDVLHLKDVKTMAISRSLDNFLI